MPDLDKRQQDILALTRELLTRLEREDLTELSVTRGEIRVRVRRDDRGVARVVAADATGERALPERRDEGADEVDAGVIEVSEYAMLRDGEAKQINRLVELLVSGLRPAVQAV